jgi:hypothetical protein
MKPKVWTVVDRKLGFRAIKREQYRQHRSQADRFADREKWAHWGKLYGIRSVIVAEVECREHKSVWSRHVFVRCLQFLSLVDANTGVVKAAIEVEEDTSTMERGRKHQPPSWDNAVSELIESLPQDFREPEHRRIQEYKELSQKRVDER